MSLFLYMIISQAYPPPSFADKVKDIYMKGMEGERFLSESDVACASGEEKKGESYLVSFRLAEGVKSRVENFAKENHGIKANLLLCGKPIAISLGRELENAEDLIRVEVPKAYRECVREAIKAKTACAKP